MVKKTILIIEDDNFLQGLEAKKLEKEGYHVLTASNGAETFKIMEGGVELDLILLDLLLPEVDGFTILKRIREDEKLGEIPVIIFSNMSEESDVEKATKLGISEFMVKSNFTLDELATKIRLLIGE